MCDICRFFDCPGCDLTCSLCECDVDPRLLDCDGVCLDCRRAARELEDESLVAELENDMGLRDDLADAARDAWLISMEGEDFGDFGERWDDLLSEDRPLPHHAA